MGLERRVVVAGWGQVTQPKMLQGAAQDPLGLMVEAAKKAERIISPNPLLSGMDAVFVVRPLSRHYDAPQKRLCKKLGMAPKFADVSGIGGNSPQTLINIAAGMIARGEIDSALVAGAECYVQREKKKAGEIENALFSGITADYTGDDLIGTTPVERLHGIEHPMQGFPLYETALWAASGLDIKAYLEKVGRMWAGFSSVAADHPYAWSKTARTFEEIITPGPLNRPIAFPYTKYMNSFVTVDQGAAVILMAEQKAEPLVPKNRRKVYFAGGGFAVDRQRFMIEKSDFTACPPMKDAVDKALARSGFNLSDVDCFDLYSCFPCAVSIAKKMIGIKDDDPRPLTLTGGLGFFGGPGNNYNLHGVATLAERISQGKVNQGLVTALGWFMHKHAAGIYTHQPVDGGIADYDVQDQNEPFVGQPPEKIQERVEDSFGMIETYTVVFKRNAEPAYGVVYGRTDNGLRFIARSIEKPEVFKTLMSKNQVGQRVRVSYDAKKEMNMAERL